MTWLKNFSIRYKILLVAFIAILGFSINLVFNYQITNANKQSLEKIQNLYFPTLEGISKNQVRLDQIKALMNDAVGSDEEDLVEDADSVAEEITKTFDEIILLDETTRIEIENLHQQFEIYYKSVRLLTMGMLNESISAQDVKTSVERMRRNLAQFDDHLKSFHETSYQRFTGGIEAVGSNSQFALEIGLIVSLIAVFVVALIGWTISSMVTRDINRVVGSLKGMARGEGDLTLRLQASGNDEIGQLVNAFNTFVAKLQTIISDIASSTEQIASSAVEMSAISDESDGNVKIQLQQTEQVATAINQMTATEQEVSRNANGAASSAREARKLADNGYTVVEDTIKSIEALSEDVDKASEVIRRLESDSENIGAILDVIRGISDQTNLLALNAAIEAARAGEQGRGFAVVADEVRTLASRTQESTQEIHTMIESLQSGSRDTVEAMEQGRAKAQISLETAAQAGELLNSITTAVSNISDMNTQIATAAEQQSNVAEEINVNIVSITQLGEQAASGASHTSDASDELAELAETLKSTVSQFKI